MEGQDLIGLILAGGRGTRMGGADKALVELGGRPLLAHVLDRLAPQVSGVVLSANGDPGRFARFGLTVLPDTLPDRPGPLAGILAGLEHAAALGARAVVSAPADTPFLPRNLVQRLLESAEGSGRPLALARRAGAARPEPACGLWPVALRADLAAALAAGTRKVTDWTDGHRPALADFPDAGAPFFNVNTPADLARAEALLRGA